MARHVRHVSLGNRRTGYFRPWPIAPVRRVFRGPDVEILGGSFHDAYVNVCNWPWKRRSLDGDIWLKLVVFRSFAPFDVGSRASGNRCCCTLACGTRPCPCRAATPLAQSAIPLKSASNGRVLRMGETSSDSCRNRRAICESSGNYKLRCNTRCARASQIANSSTGRPVVVVWRVPANSTNCNS